MDSNKFRWEEAFQNTWEKHGKGDAIFALNVTRRTENMQRGIVRRVLLVLDMSSSIEERDFLPSRKYYVKKGVIKFFREFTESNPLSTVGLAVVCGGMSYLVSSILCEEDEIEMCFAQNEGQGGFSLGSAFETVKEFFQGCSFLKEVIFIVSGFTFVGRSPFILKNSLINKGIIMHTIHMAGEMEILRKISEESGGIFGIVNCPEDLSTLLGLICIPPPHSASARLSMLKIGFPSSIQENTICACHLELKEWGYECPFCTTKVCKVPGVCPICENILSAPVHLLKALHWSDSAPIYAPEGKGRCRGCSEENIQLNGCPGCKSRLCMDCTGFIRQELNFCIFCTEAAGAQEGAVVKIES
ncbi:transcription initiation factor TFIIH subunit 2 [Nematocida ausubeli]|nr:transcription initiation factor TFIIH subunit 2 [Nematocida ausubeli]KAI5137621.1 transcription initiation factor TFIIH subunit 2 [Nematocida ausubeli]KAI5150538.1 transcription initiation factor TFIIH subunit 2 [Nematocida ausubeli]KAI5164332.1 transcription initiation factor TFIIH subunit 2 [Nematocida ausubeli]